MSSESRGHGRPATIPAIAIPGRARRRLRLLAGRERKAAADLSGHNSDRFHVEQPSSVRACSHHAKKQTPVNSLLTECNLHTIVRLPNGVFNPYTGIRTNLFFFTKGQPTTEVWYYEHPYPPGAKSYNKGKPIRIEEFEGERAWWGSEKDGFKSRVEDEQAWRVSLGQIKAGNFNLDLKNPHNPDTGPGDVDHLLPEYEKVLAQIAATRAELKAQLRAGAYVTRGPARSPC